MAGINGNGTCIEGRTLEEYFIGNEFWRTPRESGIDLFSNDYEEGKV